MGVVPLYVMKMNRGLGLLQAVDKVQAWSSTEAADEVCAWLSHGECVFSFLEYKDGFHHFLKREMKFALDSLLGRETMLCHGPFWG